MSECFICRGLTGKINEIIKKILNETRVYEFNSFAIGLTVPGDIQEREDELRSSLKLRGLETIKSQLARFITEELIKLIRKKIDKLNPELMIHVDIGNLNVRVIAKSLFVYARYTKPSGLPQRKERCYLCQGSGCKLCDFTGYEGIISVETLLQKKLSKFTGSNEMRFTWLGNEDKESLVLPPGRPFVVEIKNPRKRSLPTSMIIRTTHGNVRVTDVKLLPSKPLGLPTFKLKVRAYALPSRHLSQEELNSISVNFNNTIVTFRRQTGKVVHKKVYNAIARDSNGQILFDIEMDGGLPVKKLISGGPVSPSFAEVLKTDLNCLKFDIYEVREISEFRFAKIARI